ncbi:helix-turn-helix domain-containing protein [Deinococcus alpinitundrae]|uniref:helix-turn-helix domain-containing protein n=1 Tax=Deinococcus alpinitundrae TaxID=468913 RepID=UPI00137965D2|nr:helix-turn-helix domain-containing protein [Deinococcus alpinitundrae]
MPRIQKNPLRALTKEERATLERLSRSHHTAAIIVSRAKTLLAVSTGVPYTEAARRCGRRSGQGVAQLVSRFNQHGVNALETRPGGRPPVVYGSAERNRILDTARRTPDREQDGTATWSLSTLQRMLRREPGFERLSTFTILSVLHDAGLTWQRNRTWCETGTAKRVRKAGVVVVRDPDAEAKKN